MGEGDVNGPASSWTMALDPVANMRALADVQQRGARAAGELIDRLIARVDGTAASDEDAREEVAPGAAPTFGIVGIDQLVDAWAQLARAVLQAVAPFGANGATRAPVLDVAADAPGRAVTVTAGSKATVWLHNSTDDDVGPVRMHSTELREHGGQALATPSLQFTPEVIESLPARSNRDVVVVALVPEGQRPGAYRGAILVDGLPATWLPVELVVP